MAAVYTSAGTTRAPEFNNNVLTSWIPLTTSFTPAAGCEKLYMKWFYDLAAWDPGYGIFVETASTLCHPSQMTAWWDDDHLSTTVDLASTQFSIGPIVCPGTYTTATTLVNPLSSTLVACCPPPYTYASLVDRSGVGECRLPLSAGQVLTFMERFDIPTSTVTEETSATSAPTETEPSTTWKRITSTVPTATTTEYLYAIPVNGWLFPTTVDSTENNQTSSTTSTPTTTPEPGADGGGLSSGAKIGLGVGLGLGGVAIIALVALFILRRRRKAAPSPGTDSAMPDDGHTYTQAQPLAYQQGQVYSGEPKPYQHSAPPSEMYSDEQQRHYYEMEGTARDRAELA